MYWLWEWLIAPAPAGNLYWIGALFTLLCIFVASRFAFAFLKDSPRLFSAMALFACAWALVLGAYRNPAEPKLADLVTDLANFLLVYIGGLLVLHSRAPNDGHERVSFLQTLALSLLVFIAAPKALPWLDDVAYWFGTGHLGIVKTKVLASELLSLTGIGSLAIGVRMLAGRGAFLLVGVVLLSYELLGLARLIQVWPSIGCTGDGCRPAMSAAYIYGFAALKLLLTAILGSIVAYHGMPSAMREQGLNHWARRFFFRE